MWHMKKYLIVLVNGLACKDPKQVHDNDFYFSGLHIAGNTSNPAGLSVTSVGVGQIPGINTLGISLLRIDIAPSSIAAPHYHPRATEILTVLDGTILVGFVSSFPDNRLISKTLNKGDVFVFPKGLVHFLFNVGSTNAALLASLNSQNPGLVSIASNVFGSNPDINTDVLAKAFQLDKKIVQHLHKVF